MKALLQKLGKIFHNISHELDMVIYDLETVYCSLSSEPATVVVFSLKCPDCGKVVAEDYSIQERCSKSLTFPDSWIVTLINVPKDGPYALLQLAGLYTFRVRKEDAANWNLQRPQVLPESYFLVNPYDNNLW